jgi:hypothetical protein
MADTQVTPPLRIELGHLARESRVWVGDAEITRRVQTLTIVADIEDEPTRVILECVACDGDRIILTSPMGIKWNDEGKAAP